MGENERWECNALFGAYMRQCPTRESGAIGKVAFARWIAMHFPSLARWIAKETVYVLTLFSLDTYRPHISSSFYLQKLQVEVSLSLSHYLLPVEDYDAIACWLAERAAREVIDIVG